MSLSVDEFEQAFQACSAILASNGVNHTHDSEEVKASVDQTIQRFLDSAKALESIFLQKRLYLSVHRPEQSLTEEINDLRAELARKEQVLQRFHEKLDHWKSILSDPGVRPPMVGPVGTPSQGQLPTLTRPPMVPVQMIPRGPPPGIRMASGTAVAPGSIMGPRMASVPAGPGGYGPPPQIVQGQPQPQQPGQQSQQSPLAYLERTTSSIGLPDQRR